MKRIFSLAAACLLAAVSLSGQNPYLPLWEFIPDGEPYVFEDPDCPGQYRVYIYGSHDSLADQYCGREQVVWSAPVDDLLSWRYDGVIFRCTRGADGAFLNAGGVGDVLFAPDVALKVGPDGKKVYYLYPNVQAGGRSALVARSDRPDGRFLPCNWSPEDPSAVDGVLGFDPAVFVDDDGLVDAEGRRQVRVHLQPRDGRRGVRPPVRQLYPGLCVFRPSAGTVHLRGNAH